MSEKPAESCQVPWRCRWFGHKWYSVDAAGEIAFCSRCPAEHPQNGANR